ncbi:MAG: hypothetical protein Q7W13_13085 [Bacteroidia bacterium]|nr:hypothetical protein [Bacteroidia bacterium]
MANIKKIIVGSALVSVIAGAIYGVIKVTKVSDAADKLDIDFDGFTLKEMKSTSLSAPFKIPSIPTSAVYTLSLKINNPTDQDIIISKPYVKVSLTKKDGTLAKLANTAIPEGAEIKIKSKSSTNVKHDIEFRLLNVVGIMPNFFQYILSRIRGEKSTQKVTIDATFEAMGVTLSTKQVVNL